MNRESIEHLSSLMDGEVSQETGRFLVRRLGADGELRQIWARYHLIRDCLRHQDGQFAKNELSARVQQVLSNEPAVSVKYRLTQGTWLRPAIGTAVAASVALIAILTVSRGPAPEQTTADVRTTQTAAAGSFTSPNMPSLTPISQPVNLSGGSGRNNQKMNTYLLRHYQVSEEAGGGKGFVSFVPIVVTQTVSTRDSGYEKEDKGSKSDLR